MRIRRLLSTAIVAGLMGAGGTALAAPDPSFQEVDNRNDGVLTSQEVQNTDGITWSNLKEKADIGAWKDSEETVSRYEYRSGVTNESPHPRPMGG